MITMRKFFYLVCVAVLFAACERPLNVLNTDDMAAVLADIHVAEATMTNKISYASLDIKRAYYEGIFEKHGTSRETFNKSIEWYSRHPKKFEEVYAKVILLVTEKQEQVNNYAYHPEVNPAFLNLIDFIDVWVRSPKLVAKTPVADSLYFELNDSRFFRSGDKYVWRFLQQVVGSDTLPQSKLKFVIQYPNQLFDSVVYNLPDKQAKLRYTVTLKARDSIAPQRIFGWFYTASLDSVKRVSVDSISLVRYYNKQTHPLDSSLIDRLNALRKAYGRPSLSSQQNDINKESTNARSINKAAFVKRSHDIDVRLTKSKTN